MADLDQLSDRIDTTAKGGLTVYFTRLLETWVKHRATTIEEVWEDCIRNYNSEYDGKPFTDPEDAWRSRAVYPLTEQKVAAAEALLNDAMFLGGKLPYHLEPTPVPDSPVNQELEARGFNLKDNMDRHRIVIEDELLESKAMDHAKAVTHQVCLLGTGGIQAPYVHKVSRNEWAMDPETGDLEKRTFTDITPGLRHIDTFNIFLDPEGNGDAQSGTGLFIREWMDRNGMRVMMSSDGPDGGYDKNTIQDLLDGGATDQYGSSTSAQSPNRDNLLDPIKKFEVYEFAGRVQNNALKGHIKGIKGSGEDYTEVLATICNQKLLRVIKNPYPAQRRPYHIIPYQRVSGTPWGRGVAQKLLDVQDSASSLLRKYLDNKILSGDVMFKIDRAALVKGVNTKVFPGKIWEFQVGTDTDKAFQPITVPDTTAGTLDALAALTELADNVSGVPRILEGQQSARTSTAFAENQRIQAASKQMGSVLKNFDQYGWVPIIEALYDFNMEFHRDQGIKGDFRPMATGFASFENRNVKIMNLERKLELGGTYPQVGERMKYDKILEAMAEAEHMKADAYYYSDEEYAQIQQQRQEQQAQMSAQALDTEIRLMYEKSNAEAETRLRAIGAKADADAYLQEGSNQHDMTKKLIEAESRDADRQNQMGMTLAANRDMEQDNGQPSPE